MMISNGWISADEKKPEERQRVLGLFYIDEFSFVVVMLYKNGQFFNAWDMEPVRDAAFWRPLPALPEFPEDSED